MRQLAVVFKFELRELFKQKGIWLTPIVFALIFFAATFIPRFIPSMNPDASNEPETQESYFSEDDHFGIYIASPQVDAEELKTYPVYSEASYFDSEAELVAAYEADEVNHAMVIDEADGATSANVRLHDIGIDSDLPRQLSTILQEYNKDRYLTEQNLDPMDYRAQAERPILLNIETDGRNAATGYAFSYAGIFLLYFVILMSGSIVSTNVAREKSRRTMELLITQVSATNLILGKIAALTVMAIYELVLIITSLVAGYLINKSFYPEGIVRLIDEGISLNAILLFVAFGLLGCILYFFLYAAVGSLVDRVEDTSSATAPVMLTFVLAFMCTMMAMMSPDSLFMRILAFVPLSSPFALVTRHLMVTMPATEILISLAILIVSTIAVAFIAIRIYREGTLNYGQKLSPLQAFRRSRQES